MTSEQVMLLTVVLLVSGCTLPLSQRGADPLASPYAERHVFAVAPLRNESGSTYADGLVMADHLVRQLESATNLDMLPLNRTLAAMEALGMAEIASAADAMKLLGAMGADGLIVGTISAYEPYNPPKLGLAIELFTTARVEELEAINLRELMRAGTADQAQPDFATDRPSSRQPVSVISGYFDASDPQVKELLATYGSNRGAPTHRQIESSHLYRISMDLFSEFVSYVVSWRLMQAERTRLAPPPAPGNPTMGRPR